MNACFNVSAKSLSFENMQKNIMKMGHVPYGSGALFVKVVSNNVNICHVKHVGRYVILKSPVKMKKYVARNVNNMFAEWIWCNIFLNM